MAAGHQSYNYAWATTIEGLAVISGEREGGQARVTENYTGTLYFNVPTKDSVLNDIVTKITKNKAKQDGLSNPLINKISIKLLADTGLR